MTSTTYTLWKRCTSCGSMNHKNRNSCRDCGLLLTEEITTSAQAPDDRR